MLFAYFFEAHAEYGPRVTQIYQRMQERGDQLCASVFSLCELLVGPRRCGDVAAAQAVETWFRSGEPELLPLSLPVAPRFAEIRADAGVTAADALHLAIAATAGVDLFLTHDRQLQTLKVPGIDFIAALGTDLY